MRDAEDIRLAKLQTNLDGFNADVESLPPGYISGYELETQDNGKLPLIGPGVANVRGRVVKKTVTMQIDRSMFVVQPLPESIRYIYLGSDGKFVIDTKEPEFDHGLFGDYHPILGHRYIGGIQFDATNYEVRELLTRNKVYIDDISISTLTAITAQVQDQIVVSSDSLITESVLGDLRTVISDGKVSIQEYGGTSWEDRAWFGSESGNYIGLYAHFRGLVSPQYNGTLGFGNLLPNTGSRYFSCDNILLSSDGATSLIPSWTSEYDGTDKQYGSASLKSRYPTTVNETTSNRSVFVGSPQLVSSGFAAGGWLKFKQAKYPGSGMLDFIGYEGTLDNGYMISVYWQRYPTDTEAAGYYDESTTGIPEGIWAIVLSVYGEATGSKITSTYTFAAEGVDPNQLTGFYTAPQGSATVYTEAFPAGIGLSGWFGIAISYNGAAECTFHFFDNATSNMFTYTTIPHWVSTVSLQPKFIMDAAELNLSIDPDWYDDMWANMGFGDIEEQIYLFDGLFNITTAISVSEIETYYTSRLPWILYGSVSVVDPDDVVIGLGDTGGLKILSGDTERLGIDSSGTVTVNANTIALSTGGTERLRIDSSGNVLLGPTSGKMFIGDVGHGSTYASLAHQDYATTGGYAFLAGNNGYVFINKQDVASSYIGFRKNNADLMVINNDGYVGIGTASPAAKLHVSGGDTSNVLVVEGTNNTGIELRSGGVAKNYLWYNPGGYAAVGPGSGANSLFFFKNPSYPNRNIAAFGSYEALTINRGATGGVETLLDIVSGGIASFNLRSKGSTNGEWLIYSYGNLAFYNYGTSAAPLTMTPSGNVGIGTSSPAQKLHVAGNIYATGFVYAAGNYAYDGSQTRYSSIGSAASAILGSASAGRVAGINFKDSGGTTRYAIVVANGYSWKGTYVS